MLQRPSSFKQRNTATAILLPVAARQSFKQQHTPLHAKNTRPLWHSICMQNMHTKAQPLTTAQINLHRLSLNMDINRNTHGHSHRTDVHRQTTWTFGPLGRLCPKVTTSASECRNDAVKGDALNHRFMHVAQLPPSNPPNTRLAIPVAPSTQCIDSPINDRVSPGSGDNSQAPTQSHNAFNSRLSTKQQ